MQVPKYSALLAESQPETAIHITPRMWRRLLTQPHLPPGSSVLVAGRRPLDEIALLVDLAFDVQGLCEEPDAVFAGRRNCTRADFELWKQGPRRNSLKHRFDLALSVDQSFHEGNLYNHQTRLETAFLLSTLRPNSRLIMLIHPMRSPHTAECWSRHLACFPGEIHTSLVTDRKSFWFPRWTSRGTGQDFGLLAVTFRTPAIPLSLPEWEAYAHQGLLTGHRQCCALAPRISGTSATTVISPPNHRRVA